MLTSRPSRTFPLTALTLAYSLFCIGAPSASACTTFALPTSEEKIMSKSLDWHQGHGLVMTNARGATKTGFPARAGDRPPTWVSTYGSLTFNQIGREFPYGGINEAGLAIEILWLDDSVYPSADQRPSVNESQWIQYQLDRFGSVREMLANVQSVRISKVYANVHYLACDASGECATFEWLGGNLVAHTGADLVVPTLTNNTYTESASQVKKHTPWGGSKPIPTSMTSLDRFVRTADAVKRFDPGLDASETTKYSFQALSSVRNGDYTKWNIVYELKTRKVHFRTHDSQTIKTIQLGALDFACGTPARIIDVNFAQGGDVTSSMQSYTSAANDRIVEASLKPIQEHLPEGAIEKLKAYPASVRCQGN